MMMDDESNCVLELLSSGEKAASFRCIFSCWIGIIKLAQPQSSPSSTRQNDFISAEILNHYLFIQKCQMTEAARGKWEYAACYQFWLRRHNKSVSSKKKIVPSVKQYYPASSNMSSPDGSGKKIPVLVHSVFPLGVKVALYQKHMLKMSSAFLLISQIRRWAYAPYLILITALNQCMLFYFILCVISDMVSIFFALHQGSI